MDPNVEVIMTAMTRGRAFLLLAVLTANASAQDANDASDRALAKQLATELKGALSAALQISPASAIRVCSEQAPQIAARIGAEKGVKIGRTALRARSTANQPNDWQRNVLNDFQARIAAGDSIDSMEYSAVVRDPGVTERRFMKAIATEALCLTCHGRQLAPEVRAAIASRYPGDTATGFAVGDLRGAVYVVRRMPEQSK
jgi:hypothetical protein